MSQSDRPIHSGDAKQSQSNDDRSSSASGDQGNANRRQKPALVRDLMTVGVLTCGPDTPLIDLARLVLQEGAEQVVVLEEGNALGVVGQDELVRACTRPDYGEPQFASLTARDVMREGVPQVPADIPLAAAAQIMLDQGVRALFLMHHAGGIEYPAAMITYRHLLRMMTADSPDELRDLGIQAERRTPLEVFIQRRDAARRRAGGG